MGNTCKSNLAPWTYRNSLSILFWSYSNRMKCTSLKFVLTLTTELSLKNFIAKRENILFVQDTGRDRSCKSRRVRSFEEVAHQPTDAEMERLLVLKHSKLSKVDYKTPSSYKSPTQYKGWRPTEETWGLYTSPLRDRFAPSYSRHQQAFSSDRSGWGPQPGDVSRFVTSLRYIYACGRMSSISPRRAGTHD